MTDWYQRALVFISRHLMLRNVLISLKRTEKEKTCFLVLRSKRLLKNYRKCYFNLKNTIPPPCKVNAINFEYKQPQDLGSKFDFVHAYWENSNLRRLVPDKLIYKSPNETATGWSGERNFFSPFVLFPSLRARTLLACERQTFLLAHRR